MTRALLIHGGAIGDFVMSLRIVAALRGAGANHVAVLGRGHVAEIAGPSDGIDAFIDLDAGGFHALFAGETDVPPHVTAQLGGFDLAVNLLTGGTLSEKLSACGIRSVVDIDPRPRPDWRGHITDQWLADLKVAGIEAAGGPPRIFVSEPRRQAARQRLAKETRLAEKPVAVLHPGSGGRAKCWPQHDFLALARYCRTRGWSVAFLLGPAEVERRAAAELDELRQAAPLLVGWPLPEVAALLAISNVFVGNDSGIAHLSAAVGTPTVCIFGPTDPVLWRPLGEHVRVVSPPRSAAWPAIEDVTAAMRAACAPRQPEAD
jgi:ADP-heptose:LPS heptosyltransferase